MNPLRLILSYVRISLVKRNFCLIFIFVMLSLSGCSWFHHRSTISSASSEFNPYVKTGKIVDAQRLKAGGRVVIVPFKAGADVEADQELDKISLMIVKGFTDIVNSSGKQIKVDLDQELSKADFIVEGHITGFVKPSTLKRWMPMKSKLTLSVKGKMMDINSGKTLALFTDIQNSNSQNKDIRQLGLIIGQNIARFLLSKI